MKLTEHFRPGEFAAASPNVSVSVHASTVSSVAPCAESAKATRARKRAATYMYTHKYIILFERGQLKGVWFGGVRKS